MPAFLLPLALAAAPAIAKGITGLIQGSQAKKLKKADTTPAAFSEALALGRQAATSQLPGQGQAVDRLNQGFATTAGAAMRAGNGASSVLGTLVAADANRNTALSNLAVQQEQYRAGQQQQLRGLLGQQAAYQQQDQRDFDRTKSALKEASVRNLFGAVEGIASAGAYAMGKVGNAQLGGDSLNYLDSTKQTFRTGLPNQVPAHLRYLS